MGTKQCRDVPSDPESSEEECPQTLRRSARLQKTQALGSQPQLTRSLKLSSLPYQSSGPSTEPKPTNNSFPFLSLPPEIRNTVYRYVVYFPRGVVKARSTKTRLQLFQVNQQIYDEASEIFFSENVFRFYAAFVQTGEDPFGLHLNRIKRCFLRLDGRSSYNDAFSYWFIREFVNAMCPKHNLKYLLVKVNATQLNVAQKLERLCNIDFVQIDVGHWTRYYVYHFQTGQRIYTQQCVKTVFDKSPSGPLNHWQFLERVMMSDGHSNHIISSTLKEDYDSSIALSTNLRGKVLLYAQRHGGWRSGQDLYSFLGVRNNKRLLGDGKW
ncbi:MAG: hypothetical protein Q9219_001539 [cf. Caloplaca sp. 3 TL-2023]